VKLEVLTIGSELLLGLTLDTNAADLGRALAAAGAEITRRTTVADRPDAIRAAVADALERTGFVVTTGGLGPTRDDMTKTVVAELFGKRLVLDAGLLAGLEERFRRLGRPMPAINRTQAEIPEGATILPNPRGTAPGLWVEDARGRTVVLLPGVPREMRGLLVDEVLPRIARSGAPVSWCGRVPCARRACRSPPWPSGSGRSSRKSRRSRWRTSPRWTASTCG